VGDTAVGDTAVGDANGSDANGSDADGSDAASIRPAAEADVPAILEIINDGAEAYRGVIAADRWHEPYMPEDALRGELAAGVRFWVVESGGRIVGAMGLQDVRDVTLIRHAYVRTDQQRHGHGGALLTHLRSLTERPMLVGTWRAATWAVRFYRRHGFRLLSRNETEQLLRRYWTVPDRQIEESVVLADARWPESRERGGPRQTQPRR